MSSKKSPFELAVTLIEVAISRFTEVASSIASPEILISLLPGGISISNPDISIGKEKESVTMPFVIFSGASITGTATPNIVVVTLTVAPLHVAVNGDTDICIFFIFSARAEIFFSPSIKLIPQNSSLYLPSETGNDNSNDESNHTTSFGNAFPDIDSVSPCTTKEGTFSSVTLEPAIGTEAKNTQSNTRPGATLICFIFSATTTNYICHYSY